MRDLLAILDTTVQRLHDAEQARLIAAMNEATEALQQLSADLRAGRISLADARRISADLKATIDDIKSDLDANDIALVEVRAEVRGQPIAEA